MSAEAKPIDLPLALHRGENDLPFVSYQERASFQLLQVDIDSGLWVVRLRLLAKSQRDQSVWLWTGQEWQLRDQKKTPADKPGYRAGLHKFP